MAERPIALHLSRANRMDPEALPVRGSRAAASRNWPRNAHWRVPGLAELSVRTTWNA